MTTSEIPTAEPMMISLRAYAQSSGMRPQFGNGGNKPRPSPRPSEWTLVFDTETTIDAGQALRFGAYQARFEDQLRDAGLFYDPDTVTDAELAVLTNHAAAHDLRLMTREAFVTNVFYGIGYDLRATIVGFNLPYDLARIAVVHGSARGSMRGGFSFALTTDKRLPRLQIKHLSQRTSLIRFAAPFRQRKARSERKRRDYIPAWRGFFVDTGTFAAALFARSFTLASLADFLKVEHPKLSTDDHGKALTDAYVGYAVRDVQATWECYAELMRRYDEFGLTDTPAHLIYSEASIGKAYFKAMIVRPWREVQTDIPPKLLATIMSGYFGGRSEVRIRRELRRVILCDFLSMYPTVCTLMGLWPFVIADGMSWRDGTDEIKALLDSITLDGLKQQSTWRGMTAMVQIQPNADLMPLRAHYSEQGQATIGLNYGSGNQPMWLTLADCIASTILTGKPPTVLQAMVFKPDEPQAGLQSVSIGGNPEYAVDPAKDDFFKRLIELRQTVKGQRNATAGEERDRLDAEQNALKIAANATSYGVFVEVNVKERAKAGEAIVHTAGAEPYAVQTVNDEEPGRYFHPLLATLITGAARLMLAIAERLIEIEGLEWSFCDTDSMAIAKPEGMADAEFEIRVERIVEWFAGLNPYAFTGSILKVEDQNFSLDGAKVHEPLFCWAVSAKRYVLFNPDAMGQPVLRKASAHGLGHIRAPYDVRNPAKGIPAPKGDLADIGVELWHHDLWWQIAKAAVEGRPDQVDLTYHPALNQPAVSRYAATTPELLRWFKAYNRNQPYARQVKPFGFLLSLFADPMAEDARSGVLRRPRTWRPIAPFDQDHAKVAATAFDRKTGEPVPRTVLRTVAGVVRLYDVHTESKFLNAEGLDRGLTQRRHVLIAGVRHIGKEANRWEEQHFLGADADAQPDYGLSPEDMAALSAAAKRFGMRALARRAGMTAKIATRVLKSVEPASPSVVDRLSKAAAELEREAAEKAALHGEVLAWAKERTEIEGLAPFARRVGVDPKNLAKILKDKRPLNDSAAARLQVIYGQYHW